jgi:CRP-like cAMP-binding protein
VNRVLMRLPDDEQRRLRPHLEPVRMTPDTTLCDLGTVAKYAYFPLAGAVSLRALTPDGHSVELAAIGRDSLVGIPHLLHRMPAPYQSIVRAGGEAHRLRADVFVSEFHRGATFHQGVLLALHGLFVQITQAAVCHRFHTLSQRLARTLLTGRDNTGCDILEFTQESLALQLGTSRTTVSAAATHLQDRGVIRLRHGRIRIVNTPGLQRAACECYDAVRAELLTINTRTCGPR